MVQANVRETSSAARARIRARHRGRGRGRDEIRWRRPVHLFRCRRWC